MSGRCLQLVELLAMFAPAEVPEALPEMMPFVQVSNAVGRWRSRHADSGVLGCNVLEGSDRPKGPRSKR